MPRLRRAEAASPAMGLVERRETARWARAMRGDGLHAPRRHKRRL